MTDIDTALATHHAAELAESSSEWDRARRCWEICANTWDALANHAERDAALDRAGALENR